MADEDRPLGFITPSQRTRAQANAADAARASMPRFSMAPVGELPLGTKIMLTDFWKAPEVVADIGKEFTGFGQKTGSCVGVSEGNAVTTLLCVQRMIADAPRKASVVFWPFPYGRTRSNEGDRGQGEGAVDSVMGETLVKEGFFDITQPGLPGFRWDADGLWIEGGSQTEYQWSDGNAIAQKWKDIARPQAGMVKAIVSDTMGVRTAIANGYPILDGCDNFVGNGRIVGSGNEARVVGKYDSYGGHSTCFLGVWRLMDGSYWYLYSNQWPTNTYPKDPAGGGRCTVWLPESEVDKLFRTGGDKGETMALSHAPAFPVQVDKIIDWTKVF